MLSRFLAGAVQDDLALLVGEVLPRLVEWDLELAPERLDDPPGPVGVHPGGHALAPRLDRAVVQGLFRIRNNQLRVDLHARAEAVARDAHAERRVERQGLRRQLGQANPAFRAGALLGVILRAIRAVHEHAELAAARAHRGLDAVRHPGAVGGVDGHPVDDDLDRMLLQLLEALHLIQSHDHPVDADAREAGLARLVEELAELSLAMLDLRREEGDLGLGRQREELVHDLGGRARGDLAAALVAALLAGASVKDAQIVVDLGHRADGRARVRRGGLLLDRDGRRQAADVIVLRLLHLAEELARIRRQGLDVTPLPLGVERVEGQRRLARARHAGEDDQLLFRDLEVVDVEVVLARPLDDDVLGLRRCGGRTLGVLHARGDSSRCFLAALLI